MDLKELTRTIASNMKENDIRKTINATRHTLHITDDEGNVADFVLKKKESAVLFTIQDIDAVLRSTIQVIESALQRGESINVRGFGNLGVKYREPRRTKDIETGEWVDVAGRFVPKFTFGNELRRAARLYEDSLDDGKIVTRIDREGLVADEEYED
ncbi:MAG: HU family DNA-binding protein [archaeon]|nr:HU family DNA-binding protein [archaeon]